MLVGITPTARSKRTVHAPTRLAIHRPIRLTTPLISVGMLNFLCRRLWFVSGTGLNNLLWQLAAAIPILRVFLDVRVNYLKNDFLRKFRASEIERYFDTSSPTSIWMSEGAAEFRCRNGFFDIFFVGQVKNKCGNCPLVTLKSEAEIDCRKRIAAAGCRDSRPSVFPGRSSKLSQK